MKFSFKIQDYQTDAVNSVVDVFQGQGLSSSLTYVRDVGKLETNEGQQKMKDYTSGYKNTEIDLSDIQLLKNINRIQRANNIKTSDELIKDLGRLSLDVEMETGTGKTYVYIKTMFELNQKYGWSKFIVVVPSIAIREGVNKSFEYTSDHFMEYYHKKARFFIYNSSNLTALDSFSQDSGINVMIINTQAFAASFDEDKDNASSRIIYTARDEFGSRRPIDVIAANNPIIILDEPQKMGKKGSVTQKALKSFNPLFTLNYTATPVATHNMIYVLDALDAYNKKLVKKIEVKGFELKNLKGTDKYLYLQDILLSHDKPPMARIGFECKLKSGTIKRIVKMLKVGDRLYDASNEMEQYKGFEISDINVFNNTVTFLNGEVISCGTVTGDVNEKDMRRIQIRETILSHFEKEENNFNMGIKTLSLFFIDEVAKYRVYDENGNEETGEYGEFFEQEYTSVLSDYLTGENTEYQKYLKEYCSDAHKVHAGYFSIDKKGHSINSTVKRGSEDKISDDISAYDLILKNKERLLSFEEPTRFIFSHSALREGWDNPNIFQICTLKNGGDSDISKRQEVGRGLRISVNKEGRRMDRDELGNNIQKINKLTVISNGSYGEFVDALQSDIKAELYDRPVSATADYFKGKSVMNGNELIELNNDQARAIYKYLIKNDYVDNDDHISQKYRDDIEDGNPVPLPDDLQSMNDGIHKLIQSIFDDDIFKSMISNASGSKIRENPLNDNFTKKQFQELWKMINHKYVYTVSFDSDELIKNSIRAIDESLFVTQLEYTASVGQQKNTITNKDIADTESFEIEHSSTKLLDHAHWSSVEYDLIGKIAASENTNLTRKTVTEILRGIKPEKFELFKQNPEEFIKETIRLINEQKASIIVDHITYDKTDGIYDNTIFTAAKHDAESSHAFEAKKSIQNFVFTDGYAEQSTEMKFAKELDEQDEVCVYAKLPDGPTGFQIPTPVGNYSPDWAVTFNEGSVKHIYFIAETKGSLNSLDLKGIEKAKTDCARKLFEKISSDKVKYDVVHTYKDLYDCVMK